MTRSKDSCCIMDLVMQSNILDDIPTRLLSLTAESSLSRIHTQHSLPVAENQVTLAVRLPSVMRSLSGASSVKKSALLNYSESDTFLMNYNMNNRYLIDKKGQIMIFSHYLTSLLVYRI